MRSDTKITPTGLLIMFVLSLYGCVFLPKEKVDILREYIFVEKRDGGRCVDSIFVVFLCAKIDTTEEGKISVKRYGLYRRKVYYDDKLIYRHTDSVRLWYNITFWRFEQGCVCKEDSDYIINVLGLNHSKGLHEKKHLHVEYSQWGITKRSVRGIFGGCLGELSYYELVSVRDLDLDK